MSAVTSEWATAEAGRPARRSVFRAVADRIRRHIVVQRTRRILYDMPDSMLRDIGIERAAIDDIVAARIDRHGRPTDPYPF